MGPLAMIKSTSTDANWGLWTWMEGGREGRPATEEQTG
jgi:hypothetical protein